MVGSPAEITVTLFQSVELRVMVAPSSLHDGSLLFPASNIADFDIPETKYRHALPLPLQSIMTSATARVAELNAMLTVPFSLDMSWESRDTECYSSFLNTATCLLSVSLKTRILSFKKFTVILVAPHRKPRVGKFWLLSSTSAAMPSEVWNTEYYLVVSKLHV